jgi:hypothetical protein
VNRWTPWLAFLKLAILLLNSTVKARNFFLSDVHTEDVAFRRIKEWCPICHFSIIFLLADRPRMMKSVFEVKTESVTQESSIVIGVVVIAFVIRTRKKDDIDGA